MRRRSATALRDVDQPRLAAADSVASEPQAESLSRRHCGDSAQGLVRACQVIVTAVQSDPGSRPPPTIREPRLGGAPSRRDRAQPVDAVQNHRPPGRSPERNRRPGRYPRSRSCSPTTWPRAARAFFFPRNRTAQAHSAFRQVGGVNRTGCRASGPGADRPRARRPTLRAAATAGWHRGANPPVP